MSPRIQDISPRIVTYDRWFRNVTFVSLVAPEPPITDNIVKQIGESDNPKIRGAMGFPGSTPSAIEAFLLDMEAKTHVIVCDPPAKQWSVYESFETEGMSHQEMVDHASELANEWLAERLSDRIAAAEETEPST